MQQVDVTETFSIHNQQGKKEKRGKWTPCAQNCLVLLGNKNIDYGPSAPKSHMNGYNAGYIR